MGAIAVARIGGADWRRAARRESPSDDPTAGAATPWQRAEDTALVERDHMLALLRRLPGLRLAVPVAEVRRLPAGSPFRGLLELPVTFAA